MNEDLATTAKISWCPGCPNGQILVSFRKAVLELVADNKLKTENLVALSGIGCHGKITDYLKMNTFTSLHGRVIPTMTGVKLAQPQLTVVGFSGDGDSLDEGMEHLIHAARRNSDITVFLHNNQVFALTTGQATPTSPKGFKGKTTPFGSFEEPLKILPLLINAGATFVARSFALDIQKTKEVMKAAINHKGFSFVEIIQPCITFFDTRDFYRERVYWLDNSHHSNDFAEIMALLHKAEDKVPLGIFYKTTRETFEDELLSSI